MSSDDAGLTAQPAQPTVERWNQQAWPPVTFGIPAGWSDVPADQFGWLQVERQYPPDAPMLTRSRVVAAVRRTGAELQLREFDTAAMAAYVVDDPMRWADGRSALGQLAGPPETLRVADARASLMTYSCTLPEGAFASAELWIADGTHAYHFVGSAPASQREWWLQALRTMAGSLRVAAVDQPRPVAGASAPSVVRYRCPVSSQVPVTLQNVTAYRPRTFVIGSPSMVAWSMLGIAAASMYGHVRASGMEGRTVTVPATGEAMLTDDRLVLRLVAGTRAARVTLRADEAARTVSLEIPYAVVRQLGGATQGVYVDVVGRGTIWLQPGDGGQLLKWLAHLSHGKTWRPAAHRRLAAPTGITSWCQQDPRYTFGLRQGWVPAPSVALAEYGRLFSPSILRAGVVVVAGQHEVQVFVIELGPLHELVRQPDEDGLGAMVLEGITANGPLESVSIDGERLVLVRALVTDETGPGDRCLGAVAHNGTLYALWYGTVGGRSGDGSYERWLADFDTMLATWHWYG